jgi:hypothetical protein
VILDRRMNRYSQANAAEAGGATTSDTAETTDNANQQQTAAEETPVPVPRDASVPAP